MNTIDLSRFKLQFQDEFDALSLSSDPASDATWYNRTPWNGDFGSASFANSDKNSSFSVANGVLDITAHRDAQGTWTSGLLSSVDPKGQGFSQQYGYFEVRAQMPTGAGVWPSFWLVGMNRLKAASTYTAEVDIVEHYGAMPNTFSSKIHVWQRDGSGGHAWDYHRTPVPNGAVSSGFHTYGALVKKDYITFYFDGVEQWKVATPEEHKQKMMVLLDLGLGGGWPIDKAQNGATMKVDYIRVYAEEATPVPTVDAHSRIAVSNGTLALDTGVGENAGIGYRLYQAAFDRTPDTDGLAYWIHRIDAGENPSDIANGFLHSQEFSSNYGAKLSDQQFVAILYENILQREGEIAGENYWSLHLNDGTFTRAEVLLGFSESTENVQLVASDIAAGVFIS